ncbi:MAG: ATP--guanido phosphotransferase [Clostridia bacterium]|nr:ATP--guanido phosphotransferase [Clostridia bacterium]
MSSIKNWYKECGKYGDVVVSSRVRLARNIKGLPCPERMDDKQRQKLNVKVINAAGDDFEAVYLDKIPFYEAVALAEKGLVSLDFIRNTKNKLLLISKSLPVCIMVGEEDHLRIASIVPGSDLDAAFDAANIVDDALSRNLDIAFDERLGYLTACPTNLGTGMRASVMLHLPVHAEGRVLERMASGLNKIGLTIKGGPGEGAGSAGDLYILSNQVTLGIEEKSAIENLKNVASRFIIQEREGRENLKNNLDFQDRFFRSLGVLKSARKLCLDEFYKLISVVRTGASVGLDESITTGQAGALMFDMLPAGIAVLSGKELETGAKNTERANFVRRALE